MNNEVISKRQPSFKSNSFSCPHCGALAHQRFETLYINEIDDWEDSEPTQLTKVFFGNASTSHDRHPDYYDNANEPWSVSICYSCGRSSFWQDKKLVYPATVSDQNNFPEPSDDMPEKARELYREAIQVFPHSRRASAALMRAASEQLLIELTKDSEKISSNSRLNERIAALSSDISETVHKALTLIRVLGNDVLHHKDGKEGALVIYLNKDEPEIPAILANSLNIVTYEFITSRQKIESLYDSLPQGVRERVNTDREKYTEDIK